jgi:hypothetical protein
MADASIVDGEDINDWIDGSTDLTDTGVVTVSIPDANAHAWTEIYIDGFGWIPVDFTPAAASTDASEEYSIFQSLFSGLFSTTANGNSQNGTNLNTTAQGLSALLENNGFLLFPLFIVIATLVLFLLLCKFFRYYVKTLKRRNAYRNGNYDDVLPYYYMQIVEALKKKKVTLPTSLLPEEIFVMLTNKFEALADKTAVASEIFHAALYSPNGVDKEKADFFIAYAKEICHTLQNPK